MNVDHYTGQLTPFLQTVSGREKKEVEGSLIKEA